jgi:hypothetical protein
MAPEIERRVNELAKDYTVRVRFLPRDEPFAIPDLIRTKVNLLPPEIETIRIVEIIGLDLQADGGTHVAHTGESARYASSRRRTRARSTTHGDRAGREGIDSDGRDDRGRNHCPQDGARRRRQDRWRPTA